MFEKRLGSRHRKQTDRTIPTRENNRQEESVQSNRMNLFVDTDEDLDKVERRLRDNDELNFIRFLQVGSGNWDNENKMSTDVKRVCSVLESLRTRLGELEIEAVRLIHGFPLSEEVQDITAKIACESPTVDSVFFRMEERFLTQSVIQACCTLRVKDAGICGFRFTKESMELLCNGLRSRQKPLHMLTIQCPIEKDILAILSNALPGMRLCNIELRLSSSSRATLQEHYQVLFQSLAECINMKYVTLGMEFDSLTPPIQFDEPIFSFISEAIQRMVNLRHLDWYGSVKFSKEQWFRLGKAVSTCARMRWIAIKSTSQQADLGAFLDGCGPHPRLMKVDLGLRPFSTSTSKIRGWHTLRAWCLTVLLVGSSIQRAGARSSVYKIPSDIFRRLRSFLPEGDDIKKPFEW